MPKITHPPPSSASHRCAGLPVDESSHQSHILKEAPQSAYCSSALELAGAPLRLDCASLLP